MTTIVFTKNAGSAAQAPATITCIVTVVPKFNTQDGGVPSSETLTHVAPSGYARSFNFQTTAAIAGTYELSTANYSPPAGWTLGHSGEIKYTRLNTLAAGTEHTEFAWIKQSANKLYIQFTVAGAAAPIEGFTITES